MSDQPHCGCPVPVINPPDLGWAMRLPVVPSGQPLELPYPVDPSQGFPRVFTASADTRQGTSLSTESASGCGCDPRYPRNRRLTPRVSAGYRNPGLNFAASEVASLINRILYPIPGIWLGPACVHMPSGNVVLQLATPRGGPFDPVPVFTYNSQAAKSTVGRGYGVSDLFQVTVEEAGGTTNLVSGTGKFLEYPGVDTNSWGTAPASARNGLKGKEGDGWIERQPDGLEWHYLSSGYLEKIVSPSGDVWTISRTNCLVSSIAGPGSRTTTISGNGGTYTVTQPGGRVTVFTLSGGKKPVLTSVSYPGGASVSLSYGGKQQLSAFTDADGNTTQFLYDRADRLRTLITAEGHEYKYKYIFPENEYETDYFVEVTDPAGFVTTVVHDCNIVNAVVNPLGERTTFVWEGSGDSRLKAVIDANSHATTLTYTRLLSGVLALSGIERPVHASTSGTLSFGYDSSNHCISVTDYEGKATSLEWDSAENRTNVVDAESNRFTILYNSHRQPEFTIDPLTFRTTTVYDSSGNATSVANELNEVTTLTYDSPGDATAVKNPLTKVTTYTRDALGRIGQIENPLTFKTTYSYNGNSLLESSENGEGEETNYEYSGELQLTKVTDPLTHETNFGYDSRGNSEVFINAEGERTTSVYNAGRRRINTINPLGFVSTFQHDPVGNVRYFANPEWETTEFVYDAADRQKDVILPLHSLGAPFCHTFSYNGDSRPRFTTYSSFAPDPNLTSEIEYNDLGQIKKQIDPLGHATETGYDANGRPITVTNAMSQTVVTDYDKAGRVKAVVAPMGHRTTFNYDVGGRQTEVVNPDGKITTTSYDIADRPEVTIDPELNRTTTVYDKANRVIRFANGENEITTTVYDDASRIINVIDPVGGVSTTAYDAANRVTAVTNPAGETTTTVYDAAGRPTSVIRPGGGTWVTEYDKADRPTESRTPLGLRTTTVYDDNGRAIAVVRPAIDGSTPGFRTTTMYDCADRVFKVTNAENKVTTNVWDAGSRLKNVIRPLDLVTTFTYDDANRRETVVDAEGKTATTVYNNDGEVIETIDARNKHTYFEYDVVGRLIITTDAAANVTTFVYDNASRRIEVIDAEGRKTTTVYDRASRPVAVINPAGKRFTTVYDKLSRVQNTIDPLLHKTTTLYDGASRVTVTYDGEGNATQFHYNSAGLRDRITDPRSHVTTLQYDVDQRPTVTINAEGGQTESVYDNAGRVIAQVNEASKRTTFTYDKVDRRLTITNPLSQTHQFHYDDAGRMDYRIDARGWYTVYEYDKVDREVSRNYDIDAVDFLFEYDAVGNRKVMVDVTGGVRHTYAYDYDDVNRMTLAVDPNAEDIAYTYNKVGQRKTMVDPDGGTFTYSYDTIGRLETIRNPYSETTTLVYDIADRRIGQLLANGNVTSLSYDDANRLDAVESRKSTSVLLGSYSYQLDPAGNRTTLTANGGDGFVWTYDKTNQLTVEQRTLSLDTYTQTMTYDSRGNRTVLEDSGASTCDYSYDIANRLETVEDVNGITSYTFDANGNQLTIEVPSGDITTNTWNGENRLIEVEHPDSTLTEYRYNPDGLRVVEDHDGVEIRFVYDGNNRLQETDDGGLVEAEFTYIPLPYAEVLSQRRDTESSFYLADGIRNIRQLTDSSQVVTDEYAYDAFGMSRSTTGSTANSQLYKGQILSYRNDPHAGPEIECSLHHRNLSSKTGRFTSEDPAEDDQNLYRPVGNNPVNGEDPSGLQDGLATTRNHELNMMSDPNYERASAPSAVATAVTAPPALSHEPITGGEVVRRALLDRWFYDLESGDTRDWVKSVSRGGTAVKDRASAVGQNISNDLRAEGERWGAAPEILGEAVIQIYNIDEMAEDFPVASGGQEFIRSLSGQAADGIRSSTNVSLVIESTIHAAKLAHAHGTERIAFDQSHGLSESSVQSYVLGAGTWLLGLTNMAEASQRVRLNFDRSYSELNPQEATSHFASGLGMAGGAGLVAIVPFLQRPLLPSAFDPDSPRTLRSLELDLDGLRRGSLTRVGDFDHLHHYHFYGAKGGKWDLLLDSEVLDGRLIVKEAHITPVDGSFHDAQNILGKDGLEELARTLGREFNVKEVVIPTKLGRISVKGKKHIPFGKVRIVIGDTGDVTVSRLPESK